MSDTVEKTRDGAILYDTAILNQISESAFTAEAWPSKKPVEGTLRSSGRGNTMIVSDGDQEYVLRHYLRGGLPGKIVRDAYLWTGERRTRSFAEWYLLHKLVGRGLPVPQPVAARYCRSGILYRADLLTIRIPGIRSLADRISAEPGDKAFWRGIGAGLQRFHDAGVFHADLNAYNVQLDGNDRLHLLDFDRGRIMQPGIWRQKNMARLHRSLKKIKQLDPRIHFSVSCWNQLLDGYFSKSRSA